ncbi:hypothetical protein [Rhizobium sp. CSW-27]|uniref:hypothetical protein n=1 Tax=Rhizobium sp. CSW-27 TaxID=2839985 RepID=UPI001C00F1FE|nr:hypothetical protein [Rhizobium sp. CSW-27]MBT9370259.1 hypothetical protein [Rhizobium sp. CSW-27]
MTDTSKTVQSLIVQSVADAVQRPDVPAESGAVQPIVAAVAQSLAPVLAHSANTEPWYQSRVTIGAIVSIMIPLLGALGISSDVIDADQLTAILVAAGSLVGGLLTLYGRWSAKRPIGN